MLRIILVSLFFALCSTCLVRPWFWKGVKDKDLFKNKEKGKSGFTREYWQNELIIECVGAGTIFGISVMNYTFNDGESTFLIWLLMIAVCIFMQNLWWVPKRKIIGWLTLVAIFGCFIWEGIAIECITNPIEQTESEELSFEEKIDSFEISSSTMKEILSSEVKFQGCYDGAYMYSVGGDNVLIIDEQKSSLELIPIKYKYHDESQLRQDPFSTDAIKSCGIIYKREEEKVYGVFSVNQKVWPIGKYETTSYLLLDLEDGYVMETDAF